MEHYFVKPGYIYVGHEPCMVKTVLGSCISICLWDKQKNLGGMNHFIYPRRLDNQPSTKYGDVAINHLIKLMLHLGASKNNMVAHIVGGAINQRFDIRIGHENTLIAEEILKKHNIDVVTRDIGGSMGKKVVFNTATGEILVYKCMQIRESDWYR